MKQNNITLEITELNDNINITQPASLSPRKAKQIPTIDTRYKLSNTELKKKERNKSKHITKIQKQQQDQKRAQLLLRFKLIQQQKRLQRRKKLLVF